MSVQPGGPLSGEMRSIRRLIVVDSTVGMANTKRPDIQSTPGDQRFRVASTIDASVKPISDAEPLRLHAHILNEPQARAAGLGAALAAAQETTLFELRAALDDFEVRGQPARDALANAASRMVANGDVPELARARELLQEN